MFASEKLGTPYCEIKRQIREKEDQINQLRREIEQLVIRLDSVSWSPSNNL